MSRFKNIIAHDPIFGYIVLFISITIFSIVVYRMFTKKSEYYEGIRNLPLDREENQEEQNKHEKK